MPAGADVTATSSMHDPLLVEIDQALQTQQQLGIHQGDVMPAAEQRTTKQPWKRRMQTLQCMQQLKNELVAS